MTKDKYEEMELSFSELAEQIGIDDLETPEVYEIEDQGYEVLSTDPKTGEDVWKPIQNFVVKPGQDFHYELNGLKGTHEHRVMHEGKWTKLSEHPEAVRVEDPTAVVDITVKDTHTYKCGGQNNHNTTTPGGMAIPYASSIRIRITSTGQSHIKNKAGDVIGIKVKAKTIKNKVAKPFRSVEFRILFGRGVVEDEEVFDLFRDHCSSTGKDGIVMPGTGETVNVSGLSAWKNFLVVDKHGEVLHDVKFHKPDFKKMVLDNPMFSDYMEALFEASLVQKPGQLNDDISEMDIDPESFTDIQAAAQMANENA